MGGATKELGWGAKTDFPGARDQLFFNGLDYTTVDVEDVQYGDERGGVDIRVVGGPLAAAGNPQGGELRIFSGDGGGDQAYTSNIDVSNGGTLLSRDVWFDADRRRICTSRKVP